MLDAVTFVRHHADLVSGVVIINLFSGTLTKSCVMKRQRTREAATGAVPSTHRSPTLRRSSWTMVYQASPCRRMAAATSVTKGGLFHRLHAANRR